MVCRRLVDSVCAGALLFSVPSFGRVPPKTQGEDDTIVVTGKIITRGEARREARTFIRDVSAFQISGQFARWKVPVCPKATGLSAENARLVVDKIRSVATEAKIKLAKEGCKANFLAVFTDNAPAQVQAIVTKRTRILSKMPADQRDLITQGEMPVRWWYLTETESADGHQFGSQSAALLSAQIEGGSFGINANDGAQYADGYDSSLIGTRLRVKVEGATVIVDLNASSGKTLSAVASYVALVGLARIKLEPSNAVKDSILGLFELNALDLLELTARDRAFLAALYRVPPNRDKREQEVQIANEMIKELAQR